MRPCGFLFFCLPLLGHAAASDAELLAAERRALVDRYAAEERACQQRFAVTACMDDVRLRRREALQPLRERELQQEDRERRDRVAQRQEALAARRSAAAQRPAQTPLPEVRQRPSSAPAASAPGPLTHPPPARDDAAARASKAAERVRAAAQRASEAEATRATVERRQADRARSGKQVLPLPVPAASAVPR